MGEYIYHKDTTGWGIQYLQGKMLAYFNLEPANPDWFAGLSMGDGEVTVYSSRFLSVPEKIQLDTFMSTNDGLPPTKAGYSLVEIPNFIQNWKAIQTSSGLSISFAFSNEETGKFELWMNGELNASQKQQLINALKDKITITKY